jgi:hypothetical protein
MVLSNSQWLANPDTGYEIDQSIRFNEDDSAYLTRTPSSEGNRRTFTFSTWVKFNTIKADNILFSSWIASGPSHYALVYIDSNFNLRFDDQNGTGIRTSRVFRDVAAWYHVVIRVDTTDGTSGDRYQMYINGERQTDFAAENQPSQNYQTNINKTQPHYLGRNGYSLAMIYSDLYQAETHFLDGTAYDASFFGETDSATGQWIPKEYTGGNYGTNGFYITGEDSSDLGEDFSGNNNDFTSSGLATNDQVNDSPTNNFATFNPIGSCTLVSGQALTISDGNLRSSASGTTNAIEAVGTIAPTTGKYYAEFTLNAAPQLSNQYPAIGVIGIDVDMDSGNNLGNSSFFGYLPNGNKAKGSTTSSYGNTYGNGDIIGIALDLDNQKIYFSKNGTYQNSGDPAAGSNAAFTDLVAGTEYRFCVSHAGSSATDVTMNAGQLAFNTAAPTGFSSMSTANLPDPTITDPSEYFQTTLYTGNGSTQSINQSGNSTFQPDWVWIKGRDSGYDHALYDAVRGATKEIKSNATDAEATISNGVTAFESDGFALGDRVGVNSNTENFVAWQWKANGSGSSNDDGSITSTVSANSTSGFSIVTYTGTGSNATVGHGLGTAPSAILVKERGSAENWEGFFSPIGPTKTLSLNKTDAAQTSSTRWQDTNPTSSVFSVGTAVAVNDSNGNYVAYCFAEIPGFSSIGLYSGNSNADGTFVHTGFKVQWLLVKSTNASSTRWLMHDTTRNTLQGANVTDTQFFAELNNAESVDSTYDFLSNGFKPRRSDGNHNLSGRNYLYMAFAESPFKTATAR